MDVRIQRTTAPRGLSATLQTVALIRHAIRDGSQSWKVRQRAIAIVREAGISAKNYAGELAALWDYCTGHLRYTRDPSTAELVHSAELLLELIDTTGAGGDCDDQTVLLGSLAASIGFPVAIRIIGKQPGEFRHVHLRIKVGAGWVPADLTAWPRRELGFEARAPYERVFLLDGKEVNGMDGTYIGTLEGLGEGPFELSEADIAEHVGALGYQGFQITPDGEVVGLAGFFDVIGDVVGGVASMGGKVGGIASQIGPVVAMVNPAAGAALMTGGAALTTGAGILRGGGGGPAPAPRGQPAPAPMAAPPRPTNGVGLSRPPSISRPPQAIAISKGPGPTGAGATPTPSGASFFSRYKWPLILGGVVVAGGVAYAVMHKKKGRR